MKMPSKIYVWAMILFFLFTGLAAFKVTFGGSLFATLTGLFALAAAVFLFLDR